MNEEQKELVKEVVERLLANIISDYFECAEATENILDAVIEDIEETADWSELMDDEVCVGDIQIALARVLMDVIAKYSEA